MLQIKLTIITLTTTLFMNAQTVTGTYAGEYYLSGVPETACGFKLDNDSSFQFFFSQGALDRFGTGTWKVINNKIVLNSAPRPQHDFKLIESRKEAGDSVTIRVTDSNEVVLRYVYALVNGGGTDKLEGMMDEAGILMIPATMVDSIELLFRFCPEKTSVFQINNRQHNYFEFQFEPWMMEIFFRDFELSIDKAGLKGRNPVLQGESYSYRGGSQE